MAGVDPMGVLGNTAIVTVPLAIYFLLLGLLNTRSRPQIVSSRLDFIVLNACLFPVVCVPALSLVARSPAASAAILAAAGAAVALLAPARWSGWTIYNISVPEALRAVERALHDAGEPFRRHGRTLRLTASDATVSLRPVPLLRNVSIAVEGPDAAMVGRRMDAVLSGELARIPARPTAAGVTLVLAATVLLIAPLGLFADRMPEMVRLIADLVK
ncbi:MAG TPA: hypothetical protein VM389_07360 [Phycisphaerae bacterium]|nr:hypothetical protein [Phycisphaerae bacterium]